MNSIIKFESLKKNYGSARISIRKSGTEPKIRVMVESDSKEDIANIVNCVQKINHLKMSKIIIANFKMNGTKSFIKEWFNVFSEEINTSNKIIVALPSPFLIDFATNDINVASQNVSSHDSGAFTSQVSAENAKRLWYQLLNYWSFRV